MRSLLLIARREVQERMHTKSFRLFTAGLFLLVLGGIVVANKAPQLFGQNSFDLGVAADAPADLTSAIASYATIQDVKVKLVTFTSETEAKQLLSDGKIDAYLSGNSLTYSNSEESTLTAIVNGAVYSHELQQSLDSLGLTDAQKKAILSPAPVKVVLQNPGSADKSARQLVGFVSAIALYVTIAVYGNWILTGVIEEKSSRVVEVLLGLVRPYELLAGKTLGILVVAVSQLLVAFAGAVIGLAIAGTSSLPSIAVGVVIAAVPLYVLGLLLYSMIYAAAGATASRQSDAQAAATPIVIMLLLPYLSSVAIVPQNPDGLAATVLSIFPLTSPLVMPARVANGSPGALELAACYVLLVPAIALVAFVGGRVYSGAILSGRKVNWSNLLAAVLRPGQAS